MYKTKKLYYEDVYKKEFTATVLECRQGKKGYEIILDETAFYPEGGGQPSDTGILKTDDGKEIQVKDVQEKNGELLHYTDIPVEICCTVRGRIDWDRRFDLMQQHSGEHIVSGLVHEAFGYDNVGFHMGSDVITIDFSGVLDESQMAEIEAKANQIIWKNKKVEIFYPTEEELKVLNYRSKKELSGWVRIVRFPDADTCACCGTHITRTGEIGMVKLLSVAKFREGVRMEMVSGKRVLDYLNMINEQNHQISVKLSAKPDKTAQAVSRLLEENFLLKGRVHSMEEEYIAIEASKWKDCSDVLVFQEGMEAGSIQKLADAILQVCKGRCAVFSKFSDGSYKYAMGERDGDLRQFTKEMNVALNGRGGGKPFFVQGSVAASEDEIRKFFSENQR